MSYSFNIKKKKKKGGAWGELFPSPCFSLICASVPVFLAESFLCVSLFFFSDLVTTVSITWEFCLSLLSFKCQCNSCQLKLLNVIHLQWCWQQESKTVCKRVAKCPSLFPCQYSQIRTCVSAMVRCRKFPLYTLGVLILRKGRMAGSNSCKARRWKEAEVWCSSLEIYDQDSWSSLVH